MKNGVKFINIILAVRNRKFAIIIIIVLIVIMVMITGHSLHHKLV